MDEQNKTLPQAPAGSPPGQPGTEVKPATSLASTEPAAEASSPNQAPQTVTPSTDTTVITPTSNAATPAVDSGAASAEASTTPAPASAPQEAAAPIATPATPPADPAPVATSAEPVVSPPSEGGVVPAPVSDVPTLPVSSGSTAASDGAPAAHDSAKGHSGHKMHAPHMKLPSRKGVGLILIVLVLLVSLGSTIYFAIGQRNAKKEVADLKSRVAMLDSDVHDLPEGAVKLSECVPNMGFHYLEQGADPKFGPFLLVSTKGKVIGSEYMFNNSMLTKIPDAQIPLEVLLTNGPVLLHDWQYNSIDFSRATAGHPGFEDDHYDVHLYTVNPEEQKRACE